MRREDGGMSEGNYAKRRNRFPHFEGFSLPTFVIVSILDCLLLLLYTALLSLPTLEGVFPDIDDDIMFRVTFEGSSAVYDRERFSGLRRNPNDNPTT